MEDSAPEWSAPFPRNIVLVMFQDGAARDAKQQATDAVQGVVIGGAPLSKGGYYYIRIPDDGTSRPLFRAIKILQSFPQVELATPELPAINSERYSEYAAAPGDTLRPQVPLSRVLPDDSARTVPSPFGTAERYYRDIVGIVFFDTTSGATIRAILEKYRGSIIAGGAALPHAVYYVQVPDPGGTYTAIDSVAAAIRRESGVASTNLPQWRGRIQVRSP